jgi:opacity protein-like surface antigen
MKILGKLLFLSFLSYGAFSMANNLDALDNQIDKKGVLNSKEVAGANLKKNTKPKMNHAKHDLNHDQMDHHQIDHKNNSETYGFWGKKAGSLIIGGNFTVGIHPNKDFGFDLRDLLNGTEIDHNYYDYDINHAYFDQKKDNGYGGYVGLGYMLNPSMQMSLEGGYSRFKNHDKHNNVNSNSGHHHDGDHHNHIKSKIWHGMINFTQYFDYIGKGVRPYVTVGGGFARIHADGNLSFNSTLSNQSLSLSKCGEIMVDNHGPQVINVEFHDLEKFTFAYQLGLGFEASTSKNYSFGAGYKYFATHAIETHDKDLKLEVSISDQNSQNMKKISNTNNIDFGSLKHQNHMLNLFVKFHI